ncbi:MAG: MarR family transcriptional regulator [Nitriliruptoraceae bacterium]|nr:MarR family transcriptional regulator [Nitriliruptoraceae bacterium]
MTTQIRFEDWASSHGPEGIRELDTFFRGVAEARYVVRRVTRIVDEQARGEGLDPLEHQLLLQLFGFKGGPMRINELADRLDVPAAVASRLVKGLEERGYVQRKKSSSDRRVTDVFLLPDGEQACVAIWEKVRFRMEYFQQLLPDDAKRLALSVFGFYVGAALEFVDTDGNDDGR